MRTPGASTANAPTTVMRGVTRVDFPPGVYPWSGDLVDNSGKFADIAVLTLDGDIPWFAEIAELPDGYPGNNVWGLQVGRGDHNGRENSLSQLHEVWNKTYSSNVNDGHFLLEGEQTNSGDSGGPFYTYNANTGRYEVHGVLFGKVWEWAWRNEYTSIHHHLDWMIAKTYFANLAWSANSFISGTFHRTVVLPAGQNSNHCVLKCTKDAQCAAVSYRNQYCYMFSSVSSYITWSGFWSAPVP